MTETLSVKADELTEDELIATLRNGRRVRLITESIGGEQTVTLRFDGETFYCDTPTRLHRHAEEAAMRTCITSNGYARETGEAE